PRPPLPLPTRRSSDLIGCLPPLTSQYLAPGPSRASRWPSMDRWKVAQESSCFRHRQNAVARSARGPRPSIASSSDQPNGVCPIRSEEHTSELQSLTNL